MNRLLKEINQKLRQLNSISAKLDYWESQVFPKYEFTHGYWEDSLRVQDSIFTDFEIEEYNTNLKIPKEIHSEHFKDGYLNIEYSYWFLKFNAKIFCRQVLIPMFVKKSDNPLKVDFILSELKELKRIEEDATKHFIDKDFDIYSKRYNQTYIKQKTLKRIQSNYYEDNLLEYVHSLGNQTVTLYSKHIYFKSYLIDELKKIDGNSYNKLFEENKVEPFESIILRVLLNLSINPIEFKNEDGIRNHFYHILSALSNDVYVTAESNSRAGRTDLLIEGEFGRVIIEFKIWKRNNYKEIVQQTIGYLSDFDNEGYIVVLNKQKKLINKDYLDIIARKETCIVGNVKSIKYKDTDYKYYKSKHKVDLKPKSITHFIHNENQ